MSIDLTKLSADIETLKSMVQTAVAGIVDLKKQILILQTASANGKLDSDAQTAVDALDVKIQEMEAQLAVHDAAVPPLPVPTPALSTPLVPTGTAVNL